MSVFGSGGKLAVFLLWREIFITTGKKKFQSSVSFWFWREIGSFFVVARIHYDRNKKKVQSSVWRVCQFLILAGNWQFFCCGEKFSLQSEKKSFSRLSGGCVSFWFWQEIGSFFVVAVNFHYDRKKKVPVICLAGVSVFGSGRKLAVFLLWQ